jgi:hypothetical protein
MPAPLARSAIWPPEPADSFADFLATKHIPTSTVYIDHNPTFIKITNQVQCSM